MDNFYKAMYFNFFHSGDPTILNKSCKAWISSKSQDALILTKTKIFFNKVKTDKFTKAYKT